MMKEEYKLKDIFENQILNQLYETSGDGFQGIYINMYGEPEEIRETKQARINLEDYIKDIVEDKEKQQEFWLKLDRYEGYMSGEMSFWNKQYYKLGFLDKMYLKKEVKEIRNNLQKNTFNENTEKNFFQDDSGHIMEYFEYYRYNYWTKNKDYIEIENKMREIKQKYPNIRNLIEEQIATELTKEEIKALLEYICLNDEIEQMEKIETFKLGIKEGMIL